jgi:hypothetical protein
VPGESHGRASRADRGDPVIAPSDDAARVEAIAVATSVAVELVRLAIRLFGGTDRIRAILDAEDRVIEAEAEARERAKFGAGGGGEPGGDASAAG